MAVVRLGKNTFDLRVNLLSTSHTCSFMVYQYVRSEFFLSLRFKGNFLCGTKKHESSSKKKQKLNDQPPKLNCVRIGISEFSCASVSKRV